MLLTPVSFTEENKLTLHLVFIGVDSYSLPENDSFAQETEELLKTFEKRANHLYNVEKDVILRKKATKTNSLKLLSRISQTDLTILYISTHGSYDEKDGYKFHVNQGKVSSQEIKKQLSGFKGILFIIVDTCHAGGLITDWNHKTNITILSACGKEEITYVWGLSSILIDGLNGQADKNHDKLIFLKELTEFSTKKNQNIIISNNKLDIPLVNC